MPRKTGYLSSKEKESRALGGFTWFPFDVIDWLTSSDVAKMTAAEKGVYIQLLAVQWRDGYISSDIKICAKSTGFRPDLLTRWFRKWSHLFPESAANPSYLRNPKLHKIALEVAKTTATTPVEERTTDDNTSKFSSAPNGAGKKKTSKRTEPDPNCPQCHGEGIIDVPAYPDRPDMAWNTVARDCECTIPKGTAR
jgi:hypothetical protein